MTRTDYAQVHAAVMRCVSELRGVSRRLYVTDGATAELLSKQADELQTMIGKLQPHRELHDTIGD